MLLGDPVRLRQVVMNLLSNAVKFTDSGTVEFLASVSTQNSDKITIQFDVKDSGIGMTPEQIDKIFKPFAQAEDSITRRFGGTGLGLTISKNIIELMGGTLNVESVPGEGSRFTFNITFDLIDETDITQEQNTESELERPNFSGEVLICEDNLLNRDVICDHLDRIGLKTITVENGKEGVEIITKRIKDNEKPFDLIFMDIHMPVMDGLEAAAEITKAGVTTPIIALTANVMSSDIEQYKTSGMNDMVGKPFAASDLWKCIAKHLPVVSYTAIVNRDINEESKAKILIKTNFVTNNQKTYDNIISAIEKGDIKTAHRLVHTLKSNAGQIGEKQLRSYAAEVESSLSGEEPKLNGSAMQNLKTELSSVLDKLAPLLSNTKDENKTYVFDAEETSTLLNNLEQLLKNKDTKCLKFIDDLYDTPGAEQLIKQIEGLEFKQALLSLENLRKELLTENE